ncbi:MAG TPA: hypothetical protein VLI46_10715 [Ramlibacter sp.]|nr:hypothetical protein [Ramlibacter sp.]
MTLTVRLSEPLDKALDTFAASHGLTKSHVVQQALAEYLAHAAASAPATEQAGHVGVSANYAAFQRAGLIGCVQLGGSSATKDVVRQRIAARLKRSA